MKPGDFLRFELSFYPYILTVRNKRKKTWEEMLLISNYDSKIIFSLLNYSSCSITNVFYWPRVIFPFVF
jgi:hypothetical protein